MKPPIKLQDHPNYKRYWETMPDPELYFKGLGWVFRYNQKKKAMVIASVINSLCQRKTHPGALRIYDIGAGVGQYANELRAHGYDVEAVEPDERYTDTPRNVTDLKEVMDFSYMVNVLHHASDPIGLLRDVRRIAKVLIVSEINASNPILTLGIKIKMPWEKLVMHMNAKQVRELLVRAGWKIDREFRTGLSILPIAYNWFVCERE